MSSDVLRAYLDHPDRSEGVLHFNQLLGFLFAVANGPEVIMPSEWIPAVFGDDEPVFADLDEASAINMALIEEYNIVNEFSLHLAAVARDEAAKEEAGEQPGDDQRLLPPGCVLRDDPMANLEEDAPIADWCAGFSEGYRWLEDSWGAYLAAEGETQTSDEEELAEDLGATLMVLAFFQSRKMAEALCEESQSSDVSSLAATMHDSLPLAIREYIVLGRSLREAIEEVQTPYRRASPKVGRNDPCPCGSGRKYKQCCAVTH